MAFITHQRNSLLFLLEALLFTTIWAFLRLALSLFLKPAFAALVFRQFPSSLKGSVWGIN